MNEFIYFLFTLTIIT